VRIAPVLKQQEDTEREKVGLYYKGLTMAETLFMPRGCSIIIVAVAVVENKQVATHCEFSFGSFFVSWFSKKLKGRETRKYRTREILCIL